MSETEFTEETTAGEVPVTAESVAPIAPTPVYVAAPTPTYVPVMPTSYIPVRTDTPASVEVRHAMATDLMFASAIISVLPIICLLVAGVVVEDVLFMCVCAIPLIPVTVEFMVTSFSAKWRKQGIKIGGLVTGKVISIINIICTSFLIFVNLIGVVTGSLLSIFFGDFLDSLLDKLEVEDLFGKLALLGSSVTLVIFVILFIPQILNILLQIQLNVFRNRIMEAAEGRLQYRPKTIFLTVLLIMVGLPAFLLPVVVFLIGIVLEDAGTLLLGLAYILSSVMYFMTAAVAIRVGRGK